jgi:transcriptional regulator with XRE-family HTH domain
MTTTTTKGKKSTALRFMENLTGGPLTLANVVRSTRQGEGQTLEKFARKLRVTAQYLSDVEHGRRSISPAVAARWAKRLGYVEAVWVELALQNAIDTAGLKLRVRVEAA